MPTCGCTSPCNCYIDEDGYWAERPQDGRHNILVSGNASIEDPLTFSFLQSEFFRPPAAEVKKSSNVTPNNSAPLIVASSFDVTVYQSPNKILIASPVSLGAAPFVAFSNFFVAGASATFAANGTGERQINLISANPFTDVPFLVAGNSQPPLASRDSILSCSGFVPGYFDKTGVGIPSGFIDPRSTSFIISVYQNSGAPMNVTNIKLWVCKI